MSMRSTLKRTIVGLACLAGLGAASKDAARGTAGNQERRNAMARFESMRRLVAKVAGVAVAAVVLGANAPAIGLGGQAAHAAAARQNIYTVLSGTWLGRGLGDYGSCGTMYGQLTFRSNQEYAYTQNSEKCAAFTMLGYYRVQSGILAMHWVRCTFACQPGTDYARISFISSNVLRLGYAGRAFLYHRQ